MIYLDLLWGFLRVGLFAFGGAYAAIPLIRDVVLSYGWLTEETLTYMIAVSESTPGPIMINLATYVGSSQGGFWGAVLATLAVALPAFVIILALMAVLKTALKNRYAQAVLGGLIPCIIGIILATGLEMTIKNLLPAWEAGPDWRGSCIAAILLAAMLLWKPLTKKKISSITLILLAAVCGAAIYAIP